MRDPSSCVLGHGPTRTGSSKLIPHYHGNGHGTTPPRRGHGPQTGWQSVAVDAIGVLTILSLGVGGMVLIGKLFGGD